MPVRLQRSREKLFVRHGSNFKAHLPRRNPTESTTMSLPNAQTIMRSLHHPVKTAAAEGELETERADYGIQTCLSLKELKAPVINT